MKNIFLFDVESTELYGEGFAVGAIVALGGWNVYQRSHHKAGSVSSTRAPAALSSVPVITTSSDLDKASQNLDQMKDSSSDTSQLDSDLNSF